MRQRFSSQALFSANWWLMLVVTLLVTALTARLGFWQLDRAEQKEQAHARVLAQGELSPLATQDFLHTIQPNDALERRVDIEGEWLSQWTVYLENRSMQGRPGFWVFTPLQLSAERVVLVQRGWVVRDVVQSDKLPAIETPKGRVQVKGRWVAPPSVMVELSHAKQAETEKGFQALRQNIDMKALAQETGLAFFANVMQTGEPSEGLMRDWPAHLSGADKNRAYALQWFALALLCVGLFTWFQIIRKIKHEAH
jgi:surfeit locus 1 family protein